MSRKTLILCLATLAAMLVALGIAIAFLYSGTGSGSKDYAVAPSGSKSVLSAVPSDATLVVFSSRADRACDGVLASFEFPDSLSAGMEDGVLASLRRSPMSVSLHYSGKLIPLYVFDADGVSDLAIEHLKGKAADMRYFTEVCGTYVLVSESETLVRSSQRHIERGISIADAPGFSDAMDSAKGDILVYVPHVHARKLLTAVSGKKLAGYSSFVTRLADWSAFSVASGDDMLLNIAGSFVHDGDADEFMTVFEDCRPSVSHVADVLPADVVSFVSLCAENLEEYVSSYKSYVDARQELHTMLSRQRSLGNASGIMPEALFEILDPQEVAKASFKVDGGVETVNLVRTTCKDAQIIFKGNDISTMRGYRPQVHAWAYPSFVSSVYGDVFSLKDETCFTYIDGWVISGSRTAIEAYVQNGALDSTLAGRAVEAGKSDMFSRVPSVMMACHFLSQDRNCSVSGLSGSVAGLVGEAFGAEYAPVIFRAGKDKDCLTLNVEVYALTLKKQKNASSSKEHKVTVPSGPFKVKNSHTGKMNEFGLNSSKALSLKDETGKELWSVPFGKDICGAVHNVDYYANGKLQFIFASGTGIYVIDRLGRFVTGFPLDLGKEILLGPDLYDFNGARRYNIMVLHKDNTIEMYNLKGKKPDAWKGITAPETILSLPKRQTSGGKDFWVVETAGRTLTFPFYGGEPVSETIK